MQTSLETIDGLKRRLHVGIDATEIDGKVDEKLQELSKTITLDGFRKGKVPLRVIAQRFRRDVRKEVVGDAINSSLKEVINKESLQVATQANIEVKQDKNGAALEYTAEFEIFPEITKVELDSITVNKPVVTIDDTEIDDVIEKWRRLNAEYTVVDSSAKDGDRLLVDYILASSDDPDSQPEERTGVVIDLGGDLYQGLHQGLIGANTGQTIELTINDLHNIDSDVVGDKVCTVTVQEIKEAALPEVDASFCEQFGVKGGLEELRDNIKESLKERYNETSTKYINKQLSTQLVSLNQIEVPAELVAQEYGIKKEQAIGDLKHRSQDEDGEVALSTEQEEELQAQARDAIILSILVRHLVQEFEIKVDKDAMHKRIREIAHSFGDDEKMVEVIYNNEEMLTRIASSTLESQLFAKLLDVVAVTEQQVSANQLIELVNGLD